MSKGTITLVYNTSLYVYKFRVNLIAEIRSRGYRVIVVCPRDEYMSKLEDLGVECHEVEMSQYGMNPVSDLKTTWALYKIFKLYKPVCSLHYTIKPNIFGGIAAHFAGIDVINNIAGAGKAYSNSKSMFARFISMLYRIGLRSSYNVFFQNSDDMKLFLDLGIVDKSKAIRIPGSGVDLEKYFYRDTFQKDDYFRFLFIGRLLKEKGIQEYLEAAKRILLQSESRSIKFEIVGELDNSESCISSATLEDYLSDSRIIYHGSVSPDSMPTIIERANCIVLPSYYREGIPRSLLEAAAMGKPIITTNNVGCREVVDEGINGFKVPIKDVDMLQDAMRKMLMCNPVQLYQMGLNGRRKVEKQFDEKFVLEKYIVTIEDIMTQRVPSKKWTPTG